VANVQTKDAAAQLTKHKRFYYMLLNEPRINSVRCPKPPEVAKNRYYKALIGSHTRSFDWYRYRWPWM